MAICTFANCAYLSETSRMIALYKEMEARGVELVMATHGGPYEWLFKEEGIDYKLIDPYMDPERARQFVQANTGEKGIREFYEVDELRESVEREMAFFRSSAVTKIITGFTLSCGISARAAGIPLVVTHLGSFVPPVFERNMLVPTLVLNLRIFKLIPRSWLVKMINNLMYKSKIATRTFNQVAKEFGIKPFHSMTEMMMGDTVVVTDVPAILGIPKDELEVWQPGKNAKYYSYPAKLRYGGAIYAKLFGDVPDEVTAFLETDLPKIYVALTSGESRVLDRVYEAVKGMKAKVVICSTLHQFAMKKDPNMMVADHLPSHKVMPLMDLAIIHGGQGSVQTAIEAGTPIIGIPLHVEQGLNVSIIEKHGAGIMQMKHDIDPTEIRAKIERILGQRSFKTNMERLSKLQRQVDGVKKAVDIILETGMDEKRMIDRLGSRIGNMDRR